MKKDTKTNTIIFDNDDDLFQFAVVPEFVLCTDENGVQYADWMFTDDYNDAVAGNYELLMNDLNSRFLKNQDIHYKGITKPIKLVGNFERIFDNIDNEITAEELKKAKRCKKQL